jgi:hypothetical protein
MLVPEHRTVGIEVRIFESRVNLPKVVFKVEYCAYGHASDASQGCVNLVHDESILRNDSLYERRF